MGVRIHFHTLFKNDHRKAWYGPSKISKNSGIECVKHAHLYVYIQSCNKEISEKNLPHILLENLFQ